MVGHQQGIFGNDHIHPGVAIGGGNVVHYLKGVRDAYLHGFVAQLAKKAIIIAKAPPDSIAAGVKGNSGNEAQVKLRKVLNSPVALGRFADAEGPCSQSPGDFVNRAGMDLSLFRVATREKDFFFVFQRLTNKVVGFDLVVGGPVQHEAAGVPILRQGEQAVEDLAASSLNLGRGQGFSLLCDCVADLSFGFQFSILLAISFSYPWSDGS